MQIVEMCTKGGSFFFFFFFVNDPKLNLRTMNRGQSSKVISNDRVSNATNMFIALDQWYIYTQLRGKKQNIHVQVLSNPAFHFCRKNARDDKRFHYRPSTS